MKIFILFFIIFITQIGHSQINNNIGSKLDPDLVDGVCEFALEGSYGELLDALSEYDIKLIDVYDKINCSEFGFQGLTLMHVILIDVDGGGSIPAGIQIARNLLRGDKPVSETAKLFNMKTRFSSGDRTVLGILDWNIKNGNPRGELLKRFLNLRELLVKLGAKHENEL